MLSIKSAARPQVRSHANRLPAQNCRPGPSFALEIPCFDTGGGLDANRLPADLNTQPSSFFVGQMPSSKRKTRRKAADLHEISEPDLPESSPSRPSPKKRKVTHANEVPGTVNVRLTGNCLGQQWTICTAAPNFVPSASAQNSPRRL